MIVDSHCHLNYPEFKNNFSDILARAAEADVKYMQTICTKMSEFNDVLQIANSNENIYCSVGVHPNNVSDEELVKLEQLLDGAKREKVIGIGETGLDYYYEHSPKKMQQDSFLTHLHASAETKLPVIVHTRDADRDTIDILHSEYKNQNFTGLIHCFSTSKELAYAAMDIGMYISISGIVTFKKAQELQNIVRQLPLDRLLVETDAPYLAPVPHRGKTNEPSFTTHVVDFIADLKNIDRQEVMEQTTDNFKKLFSKAVI